MLWTTSCIVSRPVVTARKEIRPVDRGDGGTVVPEVWFLFPTVKIYCNTPTRESGDYHSSLWHTGSGNWCYKRNNTWVGTRQETYSSRDYRPSTDRFFL